MNVSPVYSAIVTRLEILALPLIQGSEGCLSLGLPLTLEPSDNTHHFPYISPLNTSFCAFLYEKKWNFVNLFYFYMFLILKNNFLTFINRIITIFCIFNNKHLNWVKNRCLLCEGAHFFCEIRAGARIFRRVKVFCYTRWLLLGASTRDGEIFCVATIWECIKSNFLLASRIWVSHHLRLSTPLKLHSFSSKKAIHRSLPPPKFWGKKPQATTKVTLTNHPPTRLNRFPVMTTRCQSQGRG